MILDYLKNSDGGEIEIPPFHTGHLGFIPDTEVSVALMKTYGQTESHCELYVTPFAPNLETLCRLQCTMIDEPGVVNKLIESVADLHINIVKKESSGINYLNHHFVEMVLDWRTSNFNQFVQTPADVLLHYDSLRHRIPIMDYRYVLLYESIMCRCGHRVLFDNDYSIPLPAISITPFTGWGPSPPQPQRVTIEATNKGFRVKFQIPPGILKQIRRLTQHAAGEPLPHILSSEASSRSLRVFFPKKDIVPKIIYVAFVHLDMPGALSAITKVLEGAEFNILTGLLRKKTEDKSGYEVVLQYIGEANPPPQRTDENGAAILKWVEERIACCPDEDIAELSTFEVAISLPEYPKPKSEVNSLEINPKSNERIPVRTRAKRLELLDNCIKNLSTRREPRPELEEARLRFLFDLRRRIIRKPTIFISYPHGATEHARRLKEALDHKFPDAFTITDYQSADFNVVVESVIQHIRDCDYFIGVWHHEEPRRGDVVGTISPWMPFEYGIGLEAGKRAIVIHSDRLPESIWNRINPGISQASYNDLTFQEDMVPKVVEYCETHWLHSRDDSE